ncbi:MAG: hypothetical protein Kow0031_34800 [Anaerolineae bacterium]
MNRWGCTGFSLGAVIGLLLLGIVVLITRPLPPPAPLTPPTVPPDATIFVSEQAVSRLASDTLGQPVAVDFEPGGQMQVSLRTVVGRFRPVVRPTILLEMQGADVGSSLLWVRLGFLPIPARWLPQDINQAVGIIGDTIRAQTPPEFVLLGLTTTRDGIEFQLKWVGR